VYARCCVCSRQELALSDRTGMFVLTVAMEGNVDSICSP
jgi:hypothetical protein